VNFAFPTAEIAVMGPEGAVNILYKKDNLDEAGRKVKVDEYKATFASPYKAAELGYIDEIILPRQTRFKLIQSLEMTQNKAKSNPPRKHGNIPL
jgi:propionyl-CoA carboxylase beta chain